MKSLFITLDSFWSKEQMMERQTVSLSTSSIFPSYMAIACLSYDHAYFPIIWCFCSLCSCQKISRLWVTFSDNQTRNRNLQSGCQKNVSCTCWIIYMYKTFQFQAPLVKKKQLLNERENEFLLMSLKKWFSQLQVETVLCAAFFLISWCVVSEGFGIQK